MENLIKLFVLFKFPLLSKSRLCKMMVQMLPIAWPIYQPAAPFWGKKWARVTGYTEAGVRLCSPWGKHGLNWPNMSSTTSSTSQLSLCLHRHWHVRQIKSCLYTNKQKKTFWCIYFTKVSFCSNTNKRKISIIVWQSSCSVKVRENGQANFLPTWINLL